MKYDLVTETFPPEINGVAMTLGRVVAGLSHRGFEMRVVAPARKDRPENLLQGVPFIGMPGAPLPRYPGLQFGWPAAGKLRRLWQKDRPDLVHIATEGPLGWSALRAANQLDIPLISSYHTNFHAYGDHYGLGLFKTLGLSWLRYIHRHALRTFVPSEDTRRQLEAEGFRHLEILGRGVDTALFTPDKRDLALRASWGATPETPVVLYVGRLAAEKNLALTIQAFDAFREQQPEAKLVLVGDGPLRPELERTRPDISFAGMRKGDDLARHYASGDLFFFASETETFGNVVTEAMSSGLLVLAYAYAAPGRFIQHEQNGWVAALGEVEDYLTKARQIGARPQDWDAIRQAARATILPFSWDHVLDAFVSHLETLTLSSPPHILSA